MLDLKAEAAHTLWAYAGVGGSDAQDLIISVEILPVVREGLEVGTDTSFSTALRVIHAVVCL